MSLLTWKDCGTFSQSISDDAVAITTIISVIKPELGFWWDAFVVQSDDRNHAHGHAETMDEAKRNAQMWIDGELLK